MREHLSLSSELEDLIIADVVLTIAFALTFSGGLGGVSGNVSNFFYTIPVFFIAITLSFVLHEYMHKIVAQRFGAIAAFKRSDIGIALTLFTGLLGFLIGIPGATMIYTNRFTQREEGLVSLAGPLTNFAVFGVFLAINLLFSSYMTGFVGNVVAVTLYISIILAFFNMLPIFPLDGSKVFRWNKPVYFAVVVVIFVLLTFIIPVKALLFEFVLMLAVALFFSYVWRGLVL